jgi:hypothetical protein
VHLALVTVELLSFVKSESAKLTQSRKFANNQLRLGLMSLGSFRTAVLDRPFLGNSRDS